MFIRNVYRCGANSSLCLQYELHGNSPTATFYRRALLDFFFFILYIIDYIFFEERIIIILCM